MNPSEESKSNAEINSIAKPTKNFPWKKILIIFLIILIFVIYPILKMRWARNKVAKFCSHVSIGMTVQGLAERAKDYALKVKIIEGSDSHPAKIIVWEGWAFARWFCEIEYSKEKVIKKEVIFLD